METVLHAAGNRCLSEVVASLAKLRIADFAKDVML